jgi:uncharacterized membrane protein (UPF0136 family)
MERLKEEVVGASAALRRPRGAEAALSMAALLTLGGVAGFAARRSKPSLIAGVVLGSCFGASGYAIGASHRSANAGKLHTCSPDDTLRNACSVRFADSVPARLRRCTCAVDADSWGDGQACTVKPPAREDIGSRIGWPGSHTVLITFPAKADCLCKSTKHSLDARRVRFVHSNPSCLASTY